MIPFLPSSLIEAFHTYQGASGQLPRIIPTPSEPKLQVSHFSKGGESRDRWRSRSRRGWDDPWSIGKDKCDGRGCVGTILGGVGSLGKIKGINGAKMRRRKVRRDLEGQQLTW
jgi:hypothetical protein